MSRVLCGLALCLVSAILLSGCTTAAAKKALNKVPEEDAYAGFNKNVGKESERNAKNAEPVADDMEPEKAIGILVDHLQRPERAYAIPAEDELRYWATKQGVPAIIVRQVRMLLKNPRVEVRAPALRLTIAYGGRDASGDLIEVLADKEYGMRSTAFKDLRRRTGRDFGFNPAGGELARVKSLESWRQWWQEEQRALAGGRVPLTGVEESSPPTLLAPKKESPIEDVELTKREPARRFKAEEVDPKRESVLPPPKVPE